ncbi:hypothetical protein AURDEDRAFT_187335 [Auricularia subglabra TFB-10046 SS5]|uniref:Ubiquitin-like domain-containing protein n=1 Tax=Auricularia subglabra (strain TFB-10046 / SS5) TaxID=717982 RepID=J0WXH4_AURST|nr:hypothetical protein AURDEDRAFT_187335 [Auricularia subglabra TFB-10046 SS5]
MADLDFVTQHIALLNSIPPQRKNDHQLPLEQWPRKVPTLGIDLPPPPERKQDGPSTSADSVTLTFKSLKPALSYTLTVLPTDTVQDIKVQLASQPGVPPPDAQRLLYKGKALADARLLREYDIPSAATINLMFKPGTTTASTALHAQGGHRPTPSVEVLPPPPEQPSPSVPALVLSPTPSRPRSGSHSPAHSRTLTPVSLTLDGDTSLASQGPPAHPSTAPTTFHNTLTDPMFWKRLHGFLAQEFTTREDVSAAFEEFLVASKNELSITDIAKIRDTVGEFGMGGT